MANREILITNSSDDEYLFAVPDTQTQLFCSTCAGPDLFIGELYTTYLDEPNSECDVKCPTCDSVLLVLSEV